MGKMRKCSYTLARVSPMFALVADFTQVLQQTPRLGLLQACAGFWSGLSVEIPRPDRHSARSRRATVRPRLRSREMLPASGGRLDAPLPLRMTTAAVEAFNQKAKNGTSMGA
jgi:hypothetical protein